MADNGKIIQGITEANKNGVKEVKSGLKDAFSPFISERMGMAFPLFTIYSFEREREPVLSLRAPEGGSS